MLNDLRERVLRTKFRATSGLVAQSHVPVMSREKGSTASNLLG
jgi:hypothetical protein